MAPALRRYEMALTQKQQQHPQFLAISKAVSDALVSVAAQFGMDDADLDSPGLPLGHLNRTVDDTASFLLKAYDHKRR